MATFTGTAGNDNFQGTDTIGDVFRFDINNFVQGDVLNGRGTATDPKDQLWLTGTLNSPYNFDFRQFEHFYTPTPPHYFCDILGIEQVYLAAEGTSVYFSTLFANRSSNGVLEVFGTGSGNDTIFLEPYATAFEARTTQAIVRAGEGNDSIGNGPNGYFPTDILDGGNGNDFIGGSGTLYGGDGNDTLEVAGDGSKGYGGDGDDTLSGFGINLTLDGGDGIDTFKLSSILSNLTLVGIEKIALNQFGGTAADYVSLQNYNPLLQISTTVPTEFSMGGGGTFDLRLIGSGTFDTNIQIFDSQSESSTSIVYGTSGRNIMIGRYGSETLYGGNSDDILGGGESGVDNLYGGSGNDTLYWTTSVLGTLHGGLGNDTFKAGSYYGLNAGIAFGEEGNDAFILGSTDTASNFKIDGGVGFDKLVLGFQGVGDYTTDDISASTFAGIEYIYAYRSVRMNFAQMQEVSTVFLYNIVAPSGYSAGLTLVGSGQVDLTNKLLSATGSPRMSVLASGTSSVTASKGNDEIQTEHTAPNGDITVYGGDGNDKITVFVSSQWNVHDVAYGGSGDDHFRVATRDPLQAIAKSVNFYGGVGNDSFEYSAVGVFDGGADVDTVFVGTNYSQSIDLSNVKNVEVLNITGGSYLTISFLDISKFNTIKVNEGVLTNPDYDKISLTLIGISSADLTGKVETFGLRVNFAGRASGVIFTASDHADNINGTNYGDNLSGGSGDDFILGYYGDDTVNGNSGNDTLNGNEGIDTFIGGDGNDTFSDVGAGETVVENAFGGYDTLNYYSPLAYVLAENVEELRLRGNYAYTVTGNSEDNFISADYAGANTLRLLGTRADFVVSYNSYSGTFAICSIKDGMDLVQNVDRFQFADQLLTASQLAASATAIVFGDETNEALSGTNSGELFLGYGGVDQLTGFGGNDFLDGGTGNDVMLGGAGDDFYIVEDFGDLVDETGGTGLDTVRFYIDADLSDTARAKGAIENIILVDGAASNAVGNASDNSIQGNSLDNALAGGIGADKLYGKTGSDLLWGGAGADLIDGGDGDDYADYRESTTGTVTISLLANTVSGGDAQGDTLIGIENLLGSRTLRDVLTGNNAANFLHGLGGNDALRGEGGDDYIIGGTGGDTLDGGTNTSVGDMLSYEDSVLGITISLLTGVGAGGDAQGDIVSGFENITGSDLNDQLTGNGGANVLLGEAGKDILDGGLGNDSLTGGNGDDTYIIDVLADSVIETNANATTGGIDKVRFQGSAGNYTLTANVENLDLIGTSAINGTGNALANRITGNDAVNILNGGLGADVMAGAGGNDLYYVDNALDIVNEAINGGTADRVLTSVNYTLGVNQQIEQFSTTNSNGTGAINLTGNNFANTILGNNGVNVLNGGFGADWLMGLLGNDLYYVDNVSDIVIEGAGGGTADRVLTSANYTLGANQQIELFSTTDGAGTAAISLVGNNLTNTILGNAGANVINGGLAHDYLTGGLGADTFRFSTAIAGGINIDTITDFVHGTDKIQLMQSVFTNIGAALNSNEFKLGAIATTAFEHIIYNSATGGLFFDVDGVGGAAQVQFAKVTAGTVLDAGDFLMI